MTFDPEVMDAARHLLMRCRSAGLMLATAESCTGGLIAAALTEIAGSSDVVDLGFVTYSNEAKQDLVNVSETLLSEHGAVSEPVARAMAEGALAASRAGLALSVTGIAGPGGGSAAKPVGLVHLAAALRSGRTFHQEMRFGDPGRSEIRRLTVLASFALAEAALEGRQPVA